MCPAVSRLSDKAIPARERLIFPLDVPSNEDAMALATTLGDAVWFYKLGLEILMGGRYYELIDWLVARGKNIMADIKFFDVPETVRSAVRQLRGHPIAFATVHGNDAMLQAAAQEKGDIRILAVTVLTSLDQNDLNDLGFLCEVEKLVLSRARRALAVGCDGVVCSGLEAEALREGLGERFLIVSPGIRPVANVDDQKRTVDVNTASSNGADYIVVGRPIRNAADPREAAQDIQRQIAILFEA
ncbi:MAG: orotidine-5'-phosphate decarboxylase [Burkholderiales bacterium]